MAHNIDFKLKINREFTMVFQKDKVELFPKKTEIILRCIEKKCEIYENGILISNKKITEKEEKQIKRLVDIIFHKSKRKTIYLVSNLTTSLSFKNKTYEKPYITKEEMELFKMFSYTNETLSNDETYPNSEKILFRIRSKYRKLRFYKQKNTYFK